MPGGNGTGPRGMGPMTGRAAGFCAGFEMPGYATPVVARGVGFGRGRGMGFGGGGRGWRNSFYATGQPGWMRYGNVNEAEPITERQALQQQMEALQAQLNALNKRLAEVTTDSE